MLSRMCTGISQNISPPVLFMRRGLTISFTRGARSHFTEKFVQAHASKIRQQAGATLKERLLGPTTGKPYIYGTWFLIGSSAFGIGLLCYYGSGVSKETSISDRALMWPEYVRTRLRNTYAYLASGLALTAVAGAASARSPRIMMLASNGTFAALLVTMAVMIGSGILVRSIEYRNTMSKHLAWVFHAGLLGAVLCPLALAGGPVLLRAAWYTAGLVGGLSALAMCAPSEKFLNWRAPLAMGLGVVIAANIGSFFFPPGSALGASLNSVVLFGGLVLFSAILLYETQCVIKEAEKAPILATEFDKAYYNMGQSAKIPEFDPINASMGLYMAILNIFIRMVMLAGNGSGSRSRGGSIGRR